MNKEEKQKIAITLIMLLIIIKFMFIPQTQKQDELISKINELRQVNNKYQHVLAKKEELITFNEKLDKVEQSLEKNIPTFTSDADFRLETQKKLETAFAMYKLKVKRFNWVTHKDKVIANVLHHKKMNITLVGKTKNFMALTVWLKKNNPQLKTEYFLIHTNKKDKTSMGHFTGSMTISAFYNEEKV